MGGKFLARARALVLFILLLSPLAGGAVTSAPHFGLTIITHGYLPFTGEPPWLLPMGQAVADRSGGQAQTPVYILRIERTTHFFTPFNPLIVTEFKPAPGSTTIDPISTSSLIVIVDWSDVACLSFGTYVACADKSLAQDVGDLVFDQIYAHTETKRFTQTPVHLIGHSRGAGVISKIAYRLGQLGIWTDQITYLDPHPCDPLRDPLCDPTGDRLADFPAKAWNSVVYAENYYEDVPEHYPTGYRVPGAYEQQGLNTVLCSLVTPCLKPWTPHANVHRYYHGTIDKATNWDGDEYNDISDQWFSTQPSREQTGYAFSRTGQPQGWPGLRPAGGIHQAFPGGTPGNRIDAVAIQYGFAYPNVLLLKPPTYSAHSGDQVHIPYVAQDLDSSFTVNFDLDDDTNPFNGSGTGCTLNLGGRTFNTTDPSSFVEKCGGTNCDFVWTVPANFQGSCYVRATVTDSGGLKRFDYTLTPITVGIVPPTAAVTSFSVPLNYGVNQDYSQVLGIPGAQNLAVTTSGKLSPDTNCGSGDVGDYIEIRDQAGTVLRRLNGTWNQTFNVAGSAIQVFFHSNCYTGYDGLVGPASVNVVATSNSPRDFGVPTNYSIGSDYQQTLFVPGAQALTVTTSGVTV